MALENLTGRELEHIGHLDKCENLSILRGVICGNTNFKKEVEEFYGLATWVVIPPRAGMHRYYDLKGENPEKIGFAPVELIEILQPFSEKTLHANELNYESVRASYYENRGVNLRGLLGIVGITVGGVGIGKSIHFFHDSDFVSASALLFLGVGSAVGVYKLLVNDPRRISKEPVNALEGYISLHDAALVADGFIQDSYRSYFIRKHLCG